MQNISTKQEDKKNIDNYSCESIVVMFSHCYDSAHGHAKKVSMLNTKNQKEPCSDVCEFCSLLSCRKSLISQEVSTTAFS